jgi:hypothetical protein
MRRVRFLTDENCDFRVVGALRATGHDRTAVSELRSLSAVRAGVLAMVVDIMKQHSDKLGD